MGEVSTDIKGTGTKPAGVEAEVEVEAEAEVEAEVEAELDDPADPTLLYEVSTLPRPDSYRHFLPGSWTGIDTSPSKSMKGIRRAVDERVRRFPELEPLRKDLLVKTR